MHQQTKPHSRKWGRMRYAPTVFRLISNNETNKPSSEISPTASIHNQTSVGAYRIRPPWQRLRSHSTKLVTIQRQITPHSRTWGRMRYAPTVFRQNSNHETNDNTSKMSPTTYPHNRTSVGAYRIRPPWRRICSHSTKLVSIQRQITPYSRTWGRMRYAPTVFRLISNYKTNKNTSKIRPTASIHKRTSVGAYRIRPPRQRIRSHSTKLVSI